MDKKESKKKKSIKDKIFISGKNIIGLEKLGKGTYGSVYKAQKKDTNEIFAIKKIKLDVDTEGIPSTALREISILKAINHPNIVRIQDLTLSEKKIELCLEYCPLDLRKFMDQYKNIPKVYNLNTIKTIIYQIIRATDHLHSRKILHRDLKPQNILICDQTLVTKIADFGLSRVYAIPIRPYTKEVLTMWYRAPELMLGLNQYSIGLDMWSVGCIFAELLIKIPMFPGDSEFDQLMKIFRVLGTPNESILPGYKHFPDFNPDFPMWAPVGIEKAIKDKIEIKMDEDSLKDAMDLLKRMLVMDPCKRISAKEAYSHNSNYGLHKLPKDTYTKDDQLKYKLRDINLIKHNPNLFTNRGSHNLYDMIGGDKTALTTLGCAAVALLYRVRCNHIRNVVKREAVWYNTLYALYGMSLGLFYSGCYFFKWQQYANEYFAFFLFKRFKGCNQLDRKDIYHLKDHENTDECYRFSQSYANSYHM